MMSRCFYYSFLGIIFFLLFFTRCSFNGKSKTIATEPVSGLQETQLFSSKDLYCENYVTTTWGNEIGEWGYPDGLHGSVRTNLLPLRFDSEDQAYFFDFANERLLIYPREGVIPTPISLKSLLIWEHNLPFLFSIDIYKDRIVIPYYYNRLGILSASGDVLEIVELPFSYDTFLPAQSIIKIDPEGRLCTFKGMYDKGWENGKWIEIPGGCMDTYFWGYYSVTGNKSLTIGNEVLEVQNLMQGNSWFLDTGLPKSNPPFSSLFGVDDDGNAYLMVGSTPPTWTYAKYNLLTHQTQIGQVQLDTSYTIAVPSVSPDGVLYILTYSNKDVSVSPRIIKCAFPNQ